MCQHQQISLRYMKMRTSLGKISFDLVNDVLPTHWTLSSDVGGTLDAANQMSTRGKDDANLLVHADLALDSILRRAAWRLSRSHGSL